MLNIFGVHWLTSSALSDCSIIFTHISQLRHRDDAQLNPTSPTWQVAEPGRDSGNLTPEPMVLTKVTSWVTPSTLFSSAVSCITKQLEILVGARVDHVSEAPSNLHYKVKWGEPMAGWCACWTQRREGALDRAALTQRKSPDPGKTEEAQEVLSSPYQPQFPLSSHTGLRCK